ncbi:uncharacterized protein LOC110683892 [Chenopodium quinoa]|uniref:uncharacterized protein LOC110683892 n=1 Tax=Chenopodium quinoa TaxID=63459 RepID=UPI000B78C7EF|nr:uncharacterized protein LOC110683892 [Chenopodium quinoa]
MDYIYHALTIPMAYWNEPHNTQTIELAVIGHYVFGFGKLNMGRYIIHHLIRDATSSTQSRTPICIGGLITRIAVKKLLYFSFSLLILFLSPSLSSLFVSFFLFRSHLLLSPVLLLCSHLLLSLFLFRSSPILVQLIEYHLRSHPLLVRSTSTSIAISGYFSSLETTLRNYLCLTSRDNIMVAYKNKKYYVDIIETKPSHAISIIETDCEVDFAPLLDYKEPERPAISALGKAQLKVAVGRCYLYARLLLPRQGSLLQLLPREVLHW